MSNEKIATPEATPAAPVESSAPVWFRQTTLIVGLLGVVAGIPVAINLFCLVPVLLLNQNGESGALYGVGSLTFALLTAGAGWAAFVHANNSLHKKPSKPMHLPAHPMLYVASFVFLIGVGAVIQATNYGAALLFPPILVACAILPPLWSLVWMIPQTSAPKEKEPVDESQPSLPAPVAQTQLIWRRGLMAFAGGATVSVFIAIILEILLPVIVLSLVFNLANTLSDQVQALFRALSNENIADALTNPSFIYIFVQIAIIAPLAEELAKPLITLPMLKGLGKQESFWIGALAGAGFAALENIIYAMSGFGIWAGILLIRSLGGALHPVGSGLVAQGWHGILNKEKDAGKNWLKRFGIAVAVHAAWNGGSLLVITLGGARFFGDLPPEIDLLGLSAAGTTLAFLLILGITALWIGRSYGYNKPLLGMEERSTEAEFLPSDRAIALWAVICLIALVPAGIAGLKLWLR